MGMWPEPGLRDDERALLPAPAAADEAAQQVRLQAVVCGLGAGVYGCVFSRC
jgi:hypothetical protein